MWSTARRLEARLGQRAGQEVADVVVGAQELANELKRRRIGRSSLAERCDRCSGTAWLPGDPTTVPASILVLAAMSLTRR